MKFSNMKISSEIFLKYGDNWYVYAHDKVYCSTVPPAEMATEDANKLIELGWCWDGDCWEH